MKNENHKYSTYTLVFIGVIIMIAALASSIDSSELDELCKTDGAFLGRIGGKWVCATVSGTPGTETIGSNNTLIYENECAETTCNTFIQVTKNE